MMTSVVPENTWFGIGWGEGMVNVDMVVMQGKDNGILKDLWATAKGKPAEDTNQSW